MTWIMLEVLQSSPDLNSQNFFGVKKTSVFVISGTLQDCGFRPYLSRHVDHVCFLLATLL